MYIRKDMGQPGVVWVTKTSRPKKKEGNKAFLMFMVAAIIIGGITGAIAGKCLGLAAVAFDDFDFNVTLPKWSVEPRVLTQTDVIPPEGKQPESNTELPAMPNLPSQPKTEMPSSPTPGVGTGATEPDLTEFEKRIVDVIENSRPGVVRITVRNGDESVGGSGFIIEGKYVVTNNHVVAKSDSVTITLSTGQTLRGKVHGRSAENDLAVIALANLPNELSLTSLTFADSSLLKVGQHIIVMGSPFGIGGGSTLGLDRSSTVTTGIISATDRTMPADSTNYFIEGLIQTDAAINPGNSGGPLLDSSGRVVGVATAVVSSAQGIGFAIPSNIVREIAAALINEEPIVQPYLGITYINVEDLRYLLNLPPEDETYPSTGIVIIEVDANSPAENAGLRGGSQEVMLPDGGSILLGGDVIVVIDNTLVDKTFAQIIRSHKPGDVLNLTILRDGKYRPIEITVGEK